MIIKYEEMGNCGCCYDDAGIGFNFHRKSSAGIEVVGNRFENPELVGVDL
jgi:hypothetical protein